MKELKLFLVALLAVCCYHQTASASTAEVYTEATARDFLEEIDAVYWQSATKYRKFSDETFSPEILMREKLRQFYEKMQKYDWQNFHDPLMKRQFEVILRGAKYPPLDFEFKQATQHLKSMSRQKWACHRENPQNCNMAFIPHMKSIVTNSDDLDELKYYWKEWRDKLPDDVKQALLYYVSYYQQLSTTPNMNASALWYDQYEDPNLINELEALMDDIQPLYKEMHAHIRQVLRAKYGNDVVPASGLIPHHLMEQVTYQAWKKDSVLRNPFPERRLPNLQAEMDGVNMKPFDMVNMSAQYFGILGFDNLTEEFMNTHFFEMQTGSGGPDCKSRIFDFGEIEMSYCPKVYYKKLMQTHGDMTRIQYAIAKNNKPVGLNQEACPGFGNALGEAIILSVSNPKHIQKGLKLLQNYDYDDILNLNRLYRLAVHTLLTLPTYFVHEKLWVDMIDGVVKPENYKCHYWNLMQKYMGVEAPIETVNNTYDMPHKFYEGIVDQFRSTKKVFGEFLGYQMYRAICLSIGEFERMNAFKTLDNCDFGCNKKAGIYLKEMMQSGSSKPWREIIKPLNIRQLPKLTGDGFLEYFEPVHSFLSDDNYEKNLNVGWTASDKCQR